MMYHYLSVFNRRGIPEIAPRALTKLNKKQDTLCPN